MAKPDLSKLSEDELVELQHSLSEQRDVLRREQMEVQNELDRRVIQRKLDLMTDQEVRSLVQLVDARTINSQETVNGQ